MPLTHSGSTMPNSQLHLWIDRDCDISEACEAWDPGSRYRKLLVVEREWGKSGAGELECMNS